MRVRTIFLVAAMAIALLPASARAQSWYVTPYIGGNFGGNADFGNSIGDTDDAVERRMTFGAAIGWVPNVVGLEFDLGFAPNFFEDTAGDRNFTFGVNNVTTMMGNVVIGAAPGAGFRPYGSAGVGLIRAHIESATGLFNNLSTNDFGVNIGGGVAGQFTPNVGIRGDIRYFRSLQDNAANNKLDLALGSFDFWRGSVCVTFRF